MHSGFGAPSLDNDDPFDGGQLPGDFYRESNSVMRGAPMSSSVMGGLHASDSSFGDDCYFFKEADDLLKGTGTYSAGAHTFGISPMPTSMSKGGFQSGSLYDEAFSFEKGSLEIVGDGDVQHGRFSEICSFPPLPTSEFYEFAATTFRMTLPRQGLPHDVGNDFLRFLNEKVKSTVKKVRESKGWVSADIFLDRQLVQVKARFYQEVEGYRLELQRRGGCTVTFNKVYNQVIDFYEFCSYELDTAVVQPSFSGLTITPEVSFGQESSLPTDFDFPLPGNFHFNMPGAGFDDLPIPPIPTLGFGGEGDFEEKASDLAPLVDRMVLTDVPSMQANAFHALGELATFKPELFTDHGFVSNVKYLLKASFPTDPEVSFAFAHMLAQVTRGAEATQLLASEGVLPLLTERVQDIVVPSVVKQELAAAIAEAAKHLSASSGKDVRVSIKNLEASIHMGSIADKKVQAQMQQAQHFLGSCR